MRCDNAVIKLESVSKLATDLEKYLLDIGSALNVKSGKEITYFSGSHFCQEHGYFESMNMKYLSQL